MIGARSGRSRCKIVPLNCPVSNKKNPLYELLQQEYWGEGERPRFGLRLEAATVSHEPFTNQPRHGDAQFTCVMSFIARYMQC